MHFGVMYVTNFILWRHSGNLLRDGWQKKVSSSVTQKKVSIAVSPSFMRNRDFPIRFHA